MNQSLSTCTLATFFLSAFLLTGCGGSKEGTVIQGDTTDLRAEMAEQQAKMEAEMDATDGNLEEPE